MRLHRFANRTFAFPQSRQWLRYTFGDGIWGTQWNENRIAGTERNIHSLCARREEDADRRDEMVRGGCTGTWVAKPRRLLAHGLRRLALRPTLVIGSVPYKQETVASLLMQPLSFLAMNPRTLANIYADIRLLGGIVGRFRAAEAVVRNMQRELAAIGRRNGKRNGRPRVYCEAWPNPRISSPPWVAELVKIAGGEMVVPAGEKVSDQQVAAAQPEIIVLAWAATGDKGKVEQAYSVEAWKDLPAVREGKVFVVRDELLNTPGPPVTAGAHELARLFQRCTHLENRPRKSNARTT